MLKWTKHILSYLYANITTIKIPYKEQNIYFLQVFTVM